MRFCKECGSMMQVKDRKWYCARCNVFQDSKEGEGKIITKEEKKEKFLELEDDVQTLPTTRAECPECKHMEAEWWLLQTRKADESETRFFRCTRCKHTWREYS